MRSRTKFPRARAPRLSKRPARNATELDEHHRVASARRTVWASLVEDMNDKGADLMPDQVTIVGRLSGCQFPGPGECEQSLAAKDLAEKLGLTPAEADLIVKYRTDHGEFKTMDDLYKAGVDRAKLDAKKGSNYRRSLF